VNVKQLIAALIEAKYTISDLPPSLQAIAKGVLAHPSDYVIEMGKYIKGYGNLISPLKVSSSNQKDVIIKVNGELLCDDGDWNVNALRAVRKR